MAHEIAKLLLEHAGTFLERAEAVDAAIGLGMPLNQIEEYLDWLDVTRGPLRSGANSPNAGASPPPKPPKYGKKVD